MNHFPKTRIPEILYKYRAFDENCIKILRDGQIYFATLSELYDENEYSFRHKNGDWVVNDNGINIYLDSEKYTAYKLSHIKNQKAHGILSLCESNSEIKMWDEYSDNFEGVCIGFDWKKFELLFFGSCPAVKNFPRRVIYQPLLEFDEIFIPIEKYIEIFTSKLPDFAFEKEWRMVYEAGGYTHPNVRRAIREIVFGYNTSKENILRVKGLVSDLPGIKFYLMCEQCHPSLTCLV